MIRRLRRPPAAPAVPAIPHYDPQPPDGVELPYVLRFSAAWSWRLLLVVALRLRVPARLRAAVRGAGPGHHRPAARPPIASPIADLLQRWGLPRSLATLITILLGFAVIAALVTLVAQQFSSGFGDLRSSFDDSLGQAGEVPLRPRAEPHQLNDFFDRVREGVSCAAPRATSAAPWSARRRRPGTCSPACSSRCSRPSSSPTTAAASGAGWCPCSPSRRDDRVHGSGERAWAVLTAYVRGTVVIAATDAMGIA